MTKLVSTYAGEAMLLRWSETPKGRTVTLLLDPLVSEQHPFKNLKCGENGQRMQLAAVLVGDDEQAMPPPNKRLPEEPEQAAKPTVYQRSQIAYLKFRDPQFISWFASTHLDNIAVDRTNGYEPHIKSYLGIKSKAELDTEGPKALAFDRLLTDFDLRGLAR